MPTFELRRRRIQVLATTLIPFDFRLIMHITDLPRDLLVLIPYYLHTLQDLYALIRTSRCFYRLCSDTKAKYRPSFRCQDAVFALPPHPHLLLSAIARQIADWAVQNEDNRERLWHAIYSAPVFDPNGLLSLGEEVAYLGLQDVRALHQTKLEIVDPISRIIDQEIGPGSRHPLDSTKICEHPQQAMYNFIIYCELFHHSIEDAYGQLAPGIEPLSTKLRQHWIKWGVPNASFWDYDGYRNACESELWDFHSLMRSVTRQSIPYLLYEAEKPFAASATCSREDWARKAPKHDQLAVRILEHQGLDTLRLLLPGGVEVKKDMISDVQEKVKMVPLHRIDTKPAFEENGDLRGWYSMMNDVMICLEPSGIVFYPVDD